MAEPQYDMSDVAIADLSRQLAEARRLLSEALALVQDLGACADLTCECGASKWLPAVRAFLTGKG